jgi:MoaA/NifB/PqqE/SkfB family radical SAM enzyme
MIDASTLCQLRCPGCPNIDNKDAVYGSGFLKFSNFKKLIDDNNFRAVSFSNMGEFFLSPDLFDILRYSHEKKLLVWANSANFNTVSDEVLEGLVKYKVRSLMCAIDGASQESYSQYRVKGDYETVISNIRKLNEYKKKYNSRFPVLAWQYVIFGHNEHEIPIAKKLASELGMNFIPKLSWNPDFFPIKNADFIKEHTGLIATNRSDFFSETGKDYMRGVCNHIWNNPKINWDGRVLGCCWNSREDFGGNVFEDGYAKAINLEKITYARKMILGLVPPREDIPCYNCGQYKIMTGNNDFVSPEEIISFKEKTYRMFLRKIYYGVLDLKSSWRTYF